MKKRKIIVLLLFIILNISYVYAENDTLENKTDVKAEVMEMKSFSEFAQGEKVIEEGLYNIVNNKNNKTLDVESNSTKVNASVKSWNINGGENQKFKFKYKDGYYTIQAVHSGLFLGIDNNKNVVQVEEKNSQKWIVKKETNGIYYILTKDTGYVLQLENISEGSKVKVSSEKNELCNFLLKGEKTVTGTKSIAPSIYNIVSSIDNSMLVDVTGCSNSENANIEIWKNNNGANQKFRFIYNGDGYYTIEAQNSKKVLTVENGRLSEGANVVQATNKKEDTQKWVVKYEKNGTYSIISKYNNLYLNLDGNATNGKNINLKRNNNNNQKFIIRDTVTISGTRSIKDGIYILSSQQNVSKVVDVYGNSKEDGGKINVWQNNGGNNQKFLVSYIGDGYYTIKSLNSGLALNVSNGNLTNGFTVNQSKYIDCNEQKWVIKDAGNGSYYIISKLNGLYLDVMGGTAYNGANIGTYFGHGGANQKFRFNAITVLEANKVIQDGEYEISTVLNNNQVLNVEKNEKIDGSNVNIRKRENENNQLFEIKSDSWGYYSIILKGTDCAVTVSETGVSDCTNVELKKYVAEEDSQKWIIVSSGKGYYYFISKWNGLYLDITGGTAYNNVNIEVYRGHRGDAQRFFINNKNSNKKIISNGVYAIKSNINNNFVIDVTSDSIANGANIELWQFNGNNNQLFRFTYNQEGYYTIKCLNSGKYLSIENNNINKRANIIQDEFKNSDSQKWILKKCTNNTYYIISKYSGLYIDLAGGFAYNGVNIELFDGNATNGQIFNLVKNESHGIDVSKYQVNTNWDAVKNSGIDFTMVRVGFRGYGSEGTLNMDSLFKQNISGALSKGIDCGVYFFSQAVNYNEGVEEAKWTLDKIKEIGRAHV